MPWSAQATYRIGRPLVRSNFALERCNADFCFCVVRIRENPESIALYRADEIATHAGSAIAKEIHALG